ncbi:MAG TPA: hypothetical protein VN426_06960 [Syntrophomonadaceae bacterium]|nr:hypothetical protein [Syntrophomonadaceae bacterium]
MKLALDILIIVLWMALQTYLSKRKQKLFGLIIPALIIIAGILFNLLIAKDGKHLEAAGAFFMLFLINIGIYFDGRKSLEKHKQKELDKMSIHDLK